jgi:hypothetical protein
MKYAFAAQPDLLSSKPTVVPKITEMVTTLIYDAASRMNTVALRGHAFCVPVSQPMQYP